MTLTAKSFGDNRQKKESFFVKQAMNDQENEDAAQARLARFGDKGGAHGSLAQARRACFIRISRAANLRAERLASGLGTKKATWISQAIETLSECHPADWYRAMAAFQAAQKIRAPSEMA